MDAAALLTVNPATHACATMANKRGNSVCHRSLGGVALNYFFLGEAAGLASAFSPFAAFSVFTSTSFAVIV